MADKFPYYKHYPKDFSDSDKVLAMSLAAVGLYQLCLDWAWVHGSIPSDHSELARLIRRDPKEVRKVWAEVLQCWSENGTPGRLINERQELERSHLIRKSEKATENVQKRYQKSTGVLTGVDTGVVTNGVTKYPTRAFGSGSVSDSESEKKKNDSVSFHAFWERYRKLRDAGRMQIACQMWLSLGCEEHAEQVFQCLTNYEASRDVANGTVQNADLWLRTVRDGDWTVTWPALVVKKSKEDEMWDRIAGTA